MKFSDMKAPSKYLTKEDIDPRKLVTIRRFAAEVLEMKNKTEDKWVLYFNEFQKGMVLNVTNQKLLLMACGLSKDADTNDAIGKKIVIWNDPSVTDLKGDLIGGIRIRQYRPNPNAPVSPPPSQEEVNAKMWPTGPGPLREPGSDDEFNDDINF